MTALLIAIDKNGLFTDDNKMHLQIDITMFFVWSSLPAVNSNESCWMQFMKIDLINSDNYEMHLLYYCF